MTEGTPWPQPDAEALDLPQIMALIRARCPWAQAHTHSSLAYYLIDEATELLAALQTLPTEAPARMPVEVIAELADVLYQVYFHAILIDESTGGQEGETFARVQEYLHAKLRRRHPHVFVSQFPVPIAQVQEDYAGIKARENASGISGVQPTPGARRQGIVQALEALTQIAQTQGLVLDYQLRESHGPSA